MNNSLRDKRTVDQTGCGAERGFNSTETSRSQAEQSSEEITLTSNLPTGLQQSKLLPYFTTRGNQTSQVSNQPSSLQQVDPRDQPARPEIMDTINRSPLSDEGCNGPSRRETTEEECWQQHVSADAKILSIKNSGVLSHEDFQTISSHFHRHQTDVIAGDLPIKASDLKCPAPAVDRPRLAVRSDVVPRVRHNFSSPTQMTDRNETSQDHTSRKPFFLPSTESQHRESSDYSHLKTNQFEDDAELNYVKQEKQCPSCVPDARNCKNSASLQPGNLDSPDFCVTPINKISPQRGCQLSSPVYESPGTKENSDVAFFYDTAILNDLETQKLDLKDLAEALKLFSSAAHNSSNVVEHNISCNTPFNSHQRVTPETIWRVASSVERDKIAFQNKSKDIARDIFGGPLGSLVNNEASSSKAAIMLRELSSTNKEPEEMSPFSPGSRHSLAKIGRTFSTGDDAHWTTNKPRPQNSVRPIGLSPEMRQYYDVENQDEVSKDTNTAVGIWTSKQKVEKHNCISCSKQYRWPHFLTCYHTLCYPCIIKRYDNTQSLIKCPICSVVTKVSDGLTVLNLNYALCREMINSDVTPFYCTSCPNETITHKFCKTCANFTCFGCIHLHTGHNISPLIKIAYDANGCLVPACDNHPGIPVNMFCKTCFVLTCSSCQLDTHCGHEICHDYDSLAHDAKRRLTYMNMVYSSIQMSCRKQIQNLNNLKQQMEDGDKKLRNEIHRTCNSLVGTINESERLSRHLINKAHDEIVTKVQTMMDEFKLYKEVHYHLQQLIPRYVNKNNQDEFTVCFPHILKTVKSLNNFYSKSDLVNRNFKVDLKFDPDYRAFNEAVHDCFQGIKFQHNFRMRKPDSAGAQDRTLSCHDEEQSTPHEHYDSVANSTFLSNVQSLDVSIEDGVLDIYPDFSRVTTPFSRSFGKFGRGEYEFAEPSGIFYLHDGTLAVCDAKNHRIAVFDSEGTFIRTIGEATHVPFPDLPDTETPLTRVQGKLYYPFRAVQCPKTYNIVVVERPPSLSIQIFSFFGDFLNSFGHSKLSYPRGLTVDETGLIFVVESRTMKFFVFRQNGEEVSQKYLASHLQFPNDIVAKGGRIYISDNRSHCVHVFDYNLNFVRSIGNESLTYFPIGVGLSHSNYVIVTDNHNTFNITVFDPDGQLICGFKSRSKHANCYNVALHPFRHELAVTTKECKVLIFHFNPERPD